MERQVMETDIVVTGFGPAAAGFLLTLAPELAKTKEDGTPLYDLELTGPLCLVIGNEGHGVSRLVKEKCDFTASIPMAGEISSLNASVAAGMIAYEITRQRAGRK